MSQVKLHISGPDLRGYALGYIYQNLGGPSLIEKEVHSNIKAEEPKFGQLTGFSQSTLVATWKTKPGYTTCGDFVGHYCLALNLPWISLLSTSDCQGYCESNGKGIAWIPNGMGLRPKTGDVFKQVFPPNVKNHTGVSICFDGDVWWTAEGGQGQPPQYDSVKKKSSNKLSNGVVGWVDLELWAEANDKKYPLPSWLVGFWKVLYQGYEYYYYFGVDRRAAYTDKPTLVQYLPYMNVGLGRFTVTATSVTVLWYDNGGYIERYKMSPGVNDKMTGSLDFVPNQLSAEKITDISTII